MVLIIQARWHALRAAWLDQVDAHLVTRRATSARVRSGSQTPLGCSRRVSLVFD